MRPHRWVVPYVRNFILFSIFVNFSIACSDDDAVKNSTPISTTRTSFALTLHRHAPGPPTSPALPRMEIPTQDPNCMTASTGNACLFLKNPTAENAAPISNISDSSNQIANLLNYVTTITPGTSGRLVNNQVDVLSVDGSRVAPLNNAWKFRYGSANIQKISQVMAYFWFNYALQLVESRTGIAWTKDQQIKIFIDDAFTGWTTNNNTIHLSNLDSPLPLAFDAGLLTYFIGTANLSFASQDAISDFSQDNNHTNCGAINSLERKRYCCKTNMGCSRAIMSGVGDYFNAIVFPNSPTVGEFFKNDLSGLGFCGFSRDLRKQTQATASDAYSACTQQGGSGQIYTMGTLYASIWWQMRKSWESKGKDRDIDTLFMLHLEVLRGEDTFLDALNKIISIDNNRFQGAYSQSFRTEFIRRGITPP